MEKDFVRAEVRVESMRLVLRHIPIALAVNLANATLAALVLARVKPVEHVAGWWLAMLALVGVRLLTWWHGSKREPPTPATVDLWERRALLGAILSGLLWGLGGVALFPEQHAYQIFIAFVVGGMAAGAAAGLSYSLPSYYGFLLPSVIPIAGRFFVEASPVHYAMGSMMLIFAMALSLFARNQHAVLTRALRLQLERSRLAAELEELLQNVESRVQERTEELRQANRKLAEEIAERRRAEEAERLARAEADLANATKSVFLAAASHDLRQPLQSLRLYLDTLTLQLSTDKARLLATRLSAILDSTCDLLNSLMDLSALESGSIAPAMQRCRLSDLVEEIAVESRIVAEQKGLTLRLRNCSAATIVKTDPLMLSRMIRNLVANAIRHTANGQILIACRHRRDHICLQVWDTGPGISAERTKQIFEAFYSRHALGEGLGLGLWIVARTAHLLQHEVSVRSKLGKGSVFSVKIARTD
ncbi:MAG: HAMP domain-containing sensor histidine kinase [Gammaproteobacteria bacterium]|jgi:signal transduction histidine kinase